MRMNILAPLALVLLTGCAATHQWRGDLQTHGALRAMFHEDQVGAMVQLDDLLPNPDLYAVGALADLAGEVTIVAGRTWLTYPGDEKGPLTLTSDTRIDAGATLLVTAEVVAWTTVVVEEAIPFDELDTAIAALASAAGLGPDDRFPFLLRGDFDDLHWHVIDGRKLVAGGTSHEDHLAAAVTGVEERISATLIGFHSPSDQGVFTHRGSTTHVHHVVDDPPFTGHVDHIVIPAGATVLFPAKGDGTTPISH